MYLFHRMFTFFFLQCDKQLQYSSLLWQASEFLFLPKWSVKTLMHVLEEGVEGAFLLVGNYLLWLCLGQRMIFEGYLEDGLI